jgi:hypothetical protein
MIEVKEIAMTMMGARVAPLGRIRVTGQSQSMWRDLLGAVLEPRNPNAENEIVEYLDHHRHDLPPEILVEIERHRPRS